MDSQTRKDTKAAIMDAAEDLMAKHGIYGVSLREILRAADANPAALNYHFNSREGLLHAILERRGRGIDFRRLELLDALDARSAEPAAEDVVDAIVDPILELVREQGESGRRFLRFLARLHSDRTGVIERLETEHFPEMLNRLDRMIAIACSHLSREERALRITMVLDAMFQFLANADVMSGEWDADKDAEAFDESAATLKRFLCGGLSAAAASSDS